MATFASAITCTVTLLQQDGTLIKHLQANLEEDQVVILRADLKIGKGDLIRPDTPQGKGEVYKVVDPVFHPQFSSMPAHYQLEVVKMAPAEALTAVTRLTGGAGWPKPTPSPPPQPAKEKSTQPAREESPKSAPAKKPAKPAAAKGSADVARKASESAGRTPELDRVTLPGEVDLPPLPSARKISVSSQPERPPARTETPDNPPEKADVELLQFPVDIARELLAELEETPAETTPKVAETARTLQPPDEKTVVSRTKASEPPQPAAKPGEASRPAPKPAVAQREKVPVKTAPPQQPAVSAPQAEPPVSTAPPKAQEEPRVSPSPSETRAPQPAAVQVVSPRHQIQEHLTAIRAEIERLVKDPAQKAEALDLVDAIEAQFDSGSPSKAVVSTLIKALPTHASITTLASFVLKEV